MELGKNQGMLKPLGDRLFGNRLFHSPPDHSHSTNLLITKKGNVHVHGTIWQFPLWPRFDITCFLQWCKGRYISYVRFLQAMFDPHLIMSKQLANSRMWSFLQNSWLIWGFNAMSSKRLLGTILKWERLRRHNHQM